MKKAEVFLLNYFIISVIGHEYDCRALKHADHPWHTKVLVAGLLPCLTPSLESCLSPSGSPALACTTSAVSPLLSYRLLTSVSPGLQFPSISPLKKASQGAFEEYSASPILFSFSSPRPSALPRLSFFFSFSFSLYVFGEPGVHFS